jgi:hypothetical protein
VREGGRVVQATPCPPHSGRPQPFLWSDKPYVAVRDLLDRNSKNLSLPRLATDQVIISHRVNPLVGLTV